MPVDPIKAVVQSLGYVARQEQKKGNPQNAEGLVLIAFGILTLGIPILGIPLIVLGIRKMASSSKSE